MQNDMDNVVKHKLHFWHEFKLITQNTSLGRSWKFLLVTLLLSVLNASCTSIEVAIPINRMESPEVAPVNVKKLQLQSKGHHLIKYIEDASSRPLRGTQIVGESRHVSGALGISTSNSMELTLRPTFTNYGHMAQLKWQFLGANHGSTESGQFSASLASAIGYGSTSRSGDQKGTFGPGGYKWNSLTIHKSIEGSLIVGYRLEKKTQLILNGFIANYDNDTKIVHEAGPGDSGGTYNFNFITQQHGAALGFALDIDDKGSHLMVEYAHSSIYGKEYGFDSRGAIGAGIAAYFQ